MAIEKIINIVANTKQAVGEIKTLFNTMVDAEIEQQKLNAKAEDMGDAYKDSSKEAEKSLIKVGKSAESQSRVMKTLKSSVNAVGTAFKSIGLGLIIALVAKVTQVMSENQKVVDFVSDVSTTLSIVVNQLFEAFSKIYTKISDATGGFDALGEVVWSVVKIAFNQLKIIVYELEAGFYALKLAYEKVFGDEKGVEKAKKNLTEIGLKINSTLDDQNKQAKNIVNNIGEAVDEVITGVKILAEDGVKAIKEVDVKSAYAQAQAITRNKKNFELLALQQQRLQLQYQSQAEALRQLRDDDTKSISERIKANDKLSEVLKKQLASESATINTRISGLQQEQNLLGATQERTNEIYQLQTDLIDVAERLKGAESEQLSNKISLLKEQRDLEQTIVDAQNERKISQLEFEESQLKTETEKLEKQKEILDSENQQILEDLDRKRELYAEGTQARTDAEQEYLNKKQENDNALIDLDIKTGEERNRIAKEVADKEKQTRQELEDAKYNIASQGLDLLGSLAGKSKGIATAMLLVEKGLAISQIITNASRAITQASANLAATPAVIGVVPNPMYAVQATATAQGIATTKISAGLSIANILAQTIGNLGNSSSIGGGTSSGGGATAPTAPSFNLVSGTGTNQIAESLATERQPIKAYVVASEMTTQQNLENNISSTASLGG